jgi:hypothetical protein
MTRLQNIYLYNYIRLKRLFEPEEFEELGGCNQFCAGKKLINNNDNK